jgi:hypothetical protein
MVLKAWETNLVESKRLARDVIEACLEALTSLDKGLIDFEGNVISEALGQIDIAKNQYNARTSKEEALMAIQNMNQIDLLQINKWIVNPSLQFTGHISRNEKDTRKVASDREKAIHFRGERSN